MSDVGIRDRRRQAAAVFQRKRRLSFGVPAAILVYFIYIFFTFDILGIAERAKLDNAVTLVSDSFSHKTHVVLDNRRETYSIAIEGEKKGTYPKGMKPAWVRFEGKDARVDLEDGYDVAFTGTTVRFTVPDYGVIEATPTRRKIDITLPGDKPVPAWISASRTRLSVTTPNGRMAVTKARTVIYRYQMGWELFLFTLDSPFYGKSLGALVSLAFSGDRVVPAHSNLAAMASDIWYNKMWRHGEVAWAIFETILIAFLGTVGAAIVALPMAFLSARNFTPAAAARFSCRRLFDFLRGIDALIWTIVLARAFGPGPLTGGLAILLTDTGTFGKLFSETLENVDNKQIEAMRATGASPLQSYRFGVIPQITPVLLSQLLYYFESNIRSATIVGAIVGGGIGLLLTQAIITQKDWEEVSYYIVLIVLMVFVIDSFSGWIRRKLITGENG